MKQFDSVNIIFWANVLEEARVYLSEPNNKGGQMTDFIFFKVALQKC